MRERKRLAQAQSETALPVPVEDKVFWEGIFGLGVEAVVHACDYDSERINEVMAAYDGPELAPEEIGQIRQEILSGNGPLVRRVV